MAQVKIFGLNQQLEPRREQLSQIIHACVMDAFGLPQEKRFHRFFPMQHENFSVPEGRSEAYTIIEINIIEGRSVAAKKQLIRLIFDRLAAEFNIDKNDVEICLLESPACNWGFRGLHGDEAKLNYAINV